MTETPSTAPARPNAKYDNLSLLSPYFDAHVMFSILSTVRSLGIYEDSDMIKAMYELALHTKMTDFQLDLYKETINVSAETAVEEPPEIAARRAEMASLYAHHIDSVKPFEAFFTYDNLEPTPALRSLQEKGRFTIEMLQEDNYAIGAKEVDALHSCAKFRYEMGEYPEARSVLQYYLLLVPLAEREAIARAKMGVLLASLNDADFAASKEGADKIASDIDELSGELAGRPESAAANMAQLQNRTWLLHHALAFFAKGGPAGREALIAFFTQDHMLQALQLNCPWLLRYLVAALVTYPAGKRPAFTLGRLSRIISQLTHEGAFATYKPDPIIEFLEALLSSFDFEAARAKLPECESVVSSDVFLSQLIEPGEFKACAQRHFFETYCNVHTVISLDTLATDLDMSVGEAERWVADLIRNANISARIDSTEKRVFMISRAPSVYQSVRDKTNDLIERTREIAGTVEAAVRDAADAAEKEREKATAALGAASAGVSFASVSAGGAGGARSGGAGRGR